VKLNILCIGDIVGRPGRRVVSQKLAALVRDMQIDCVIANAENSAGGSNTAYTSSRWATMPFAKKI
jgi:calcineurin-like phosphoesterase